MAAGQDTWVMAAEMAGSVEVGTMVGAVTMMVITANWTLGTKSAAVTVVATIQVVVQVLATR